SHSDAFTNDHLGGIGRHNITQTTFVTAVGMPIPGLIGCCFACGRLWEHILAQNSHAGSRSVPTLMQSRESRPGRLGRLFAAVRRDSRQYGFTGTRPTIDTNNEGASRAVA